MDYPTKRGYVFGEVSSAMQKAIRRADTRLAGYWAIELFESGYANYVWKRLLTVSAEDCWGILTKEVWALHEAYQLINKGKPVREHKGRIFIAKAIILMCSAKKSRDADHLTNYVYDKSAGVDDITIDRELDEARKDPDVQIPDYAYDVHTRKGKMAGKTKQQFMVEEHDALKPRQLGIFDDVITPA